MKKISYILMLFLLPICCKNSFRLNLTEFGSIYDAGYENNLANQLPKSWNGWFELRIRENIESIDGVEVLKYELAPDLDFFVNARPASFEFFSYLAFIDNHRLVFYTPYRAKVAQINKKFNLYNPKQKDFQRGYYKYKPGVGPGNDGQLLVMLENRKKKKPTELIFAVQYRENSRGEPEVARLVLTQMNGTNDTPLKSRSPNRRAYMTEQLFSFQPTYYFEGRRSVKLFAEASTKGKNDADITWVDSIFLDLADRKRYYYHKGEPQFEEKLKPIDSVLDTLRTW